MLSLPDELNEYIQQHSSPEDPVLAELNRQTWLNAIQPRMLSGYLQGKILEMISLMVHPGYILEIGTFTGYSAICMAKGLKKNGKLITIEVNDEMEDIIKEYFNKSGFSNQIELIIGKALEIIPNLDHSFDLVFIDADKQEYIDYYKAVLPKLNQGGYILADNVLWDGKVIDPSQSEDPDTKSIMDFNEHIIHDPQVENIILPIRDGINLIRKK